ncbi:MAG TPA: TolC family protein [Terracidiphilus sp.]|jgi:HAE1 family hydrophobic/amphiphilic exporter-1
MNLLRFGLLLLLGSMGFCTLHAQSGESYRSLLIPGIRTGKLSSPEHLKAYLQDGKIRIGLRDAILLALENDSDIRLQETQVELRKFALLSAFQPFDPSLQSQFQVNRYSYPTYSQLQGVGVTGTTVQNNLTQAGQINYVQTFATGTNVVAGVSSARSSTNNSFYFFNPNYSSSLNLQFTQPLLRNAGRFANTAPIKIARKGFEQSRASFEAGVNDTVLIVVSQYWNAVQARGALDVQRRALDLAEASYQRDKRALELGALPPLDISRSESEVAARKVAQIQAAYALTQAEEALRLIIGADQDPAFKSAGLELSEDPQSPGDLEVVSLDSSLDQALANRPELSASADALAADDFSVRLAKNQLKPNLSLLGFYTSNGLGGNQYDLVTGKLLSSGGFNSSFDQLFGFGFPSYGGQLTLTLPIRNRGAQGQLGTALVSKEHDLYSDRQVKELITRQVRDAAELLETAEVSLDAANKSFDLAKKSLAADQRKYELGDQPIFYVLDSQSRLAQAELALLQARVGYQLARASIAHAQGTLLAPFRLQFDALEK